MRERKEDIPLLVDHFIKKYSRQNGKTIRGLTREALNSLMMYNYPGNVRELENIVERAVVIAREEYITSDDLPFKEEREEGILGKGKVGPLRRSIEELERNMIIAAMERHDYHQTKAAEALGISERMLRYKLKKYGLKDSHSTL